ncbi:hypothetical protein E3Q11_03552 [Wallemia mellicola]|nr:hypothetical protein E3Q11_03552 [Wallemia mellicola]
MGKIKTNKNNSRHDPLEKQLNDDDAYNKFGRVTQPKSKSNSDDREDGEETSIIDPKTSSKILSLAKQQQEELEREQILEDTLGDTLNDEEDDGAFKLRQEGDDGIEEDEVIEEVNEDEFQQFDIDPSDQQAIDTFMPTNTTNRRTLADIILEKIEESGQPKEKQEKTPGLSDKVVEVYTKVGQLLSRYKSGPLPKAFKIIPSLPNWIAVLQLTGPESWTPHATYAATRLFASNLKAHQTRLFYQHVLLDRCRDNLNDPNTKKMDVHLYDALRKSLYKPAAFFKGILFPLCETGCTLKEAAVFASVLSKVSIPVLHSAAALLHLAEMDYAGPTSLFIRVLLDKKYALPYKVLDGLVYHFMRFAREQRKMPVLWHQSLLVFCQRYSADLTPEQKDALLDVVKSNVHPQISPEIRREIQTSTERGPGIIQDEAMTYAVMKKSAGKNSDENEKRTTFNRVGEHARRVIKHKNKHKYDDDPDQDYIKKGLDKLDYQDLNDEDDMVYNQIHHSEELGGLEQVKFDAEERLEWQLMLASVLQGEVLKSEKSRMIGNLTKNENESKANYQYQLWVGLRAKLKGRTVDDELSNLEECRLAADDILDQLLNFKATNEPSSLDEFPGDGDESYITPSIIPHSILTPNTKVALRQVDAILHQIDFVESFYPNTKALEEAKPMYASKDFKDKLNALCSYATVVKSLRATIQTLRTWTDSSDLDVTRASESDTPLMMPPVASHNSQESVDRSIKTDDSFKDQTTRRNVEPMSFIEKLLKEESFQTLFEKRTLVSLTSVLDKAKDLHINWRHVFEGLNLPAFDNELVILTRFPIKLMQEALHIKLEYAAKVSDPTGLVVDQLIEDIRIALSQATFIKRKCSEYNTRIVDETTGMVKWELPNENVSDYDKVLLKTVQQFFRLILIKLKSGSKALYFKETDILEDQWNFLLSIVEEIEGADIVVAERFCSLTNRLMKRIANYFEIQLKSVDITNMQHSETLFWYSTILENVRLRYRKLHRFSKRLALRFDNSSEYSLEDFDLNVFIETLVSTNHFLVYSEYLASESIYIVADSQLADRPELIINLLTRAFLYQDKQSQTDIFTEPEARYLLVISPRAPFFWNGSIMEIDLGPVDLELQEKRIRLIADGPTNHLRRTKEKFESIWLVSNPDGVSPPISNFPFRTIAQEQVALPKVDRELRKISLAAYKLTLAIGNSPMLLRKKLHGIPNRQDTLSNWYSFAAEHGQHAIKYMESPALEMFNKVLMKLAIDWLAFICEDCIPTDRKTFRWAVNALESAMSISQGENILELKSNEFDLLREKVAMCMTLLVSHFDILGARSSFEAKKEKEAKEEAKKMRMLSSITSDDDGHKNDRYGQFLSDAGWYHSYDGANSSVRYFVEESMRGIYAIENRRRNFEKEQNLVGRVLDTEKIGDRSLIVLANAASNVSIRWQQGRLIGAGTFGSVYLAVNLDTGGIMAVKEIRFIDVNDPGTLYKQIHDEMKVMEMLSHPNIVEYYGIEVHKEKVYIFEEFCQGGSLAGLLEHGRIEDESVMRVYAYQMLEGLQYLHSNNVVHRDIKPDNILLNDIGILKMVDFGAAKVLQRNRTIARTRRNNKNNDGPGGSLAGTPMYMSPEVIKGEGDKAGAFGAMDVWSFGCVLLELCTGRKPWHGLDNEWAIMFHIGVSGQPPQLPSTNELSELGIDFIRQCLIIDPKKRPTVDELLEHPWIEKFREEIELEYEDEIIHQHSQDNDYENTNENSNEKIQRRDIENLNSHEPETPPI